MLSAPIAITIYDENSDAENPSKDFFRVNKLQYSKWGNIATILIHIISLKPSNGDKIITPTNQPLPIPKAKNVNTHFWVYDWSNPAIAIGIYVQAHSGHILCKSWSATPSQAVGSFSYICD